MNQMKSCSLISPAKCRLLSVLKNMACSISSISKSVGILDGTSSELATTKGSTSKSTTASINQIQNKKNKDV